MEYIDIDTLKFDEKGLIPAIVVDAESRKVLTGVNTGDFGRTTGESFLDLLKALNGVEANPQSPNL